MFEQEFINFTLTPILAIVGAVFGLIGTFVGLFNLWYTFNQNRIRIRVEFDVEGVRRTKMPPKSYSSAMATVNAVNLSTFPITITEVGYCYRNGWFRKKFIPFEHRSRRIEDRSNSEYRNVFAPERTRSHGWAPPLVTNEKMVDILYAYILLSDGTKRRSRRISHRVRNTASQIVAGDIESDS